MADPVPYERFQEVVTQKNTLEAALSAEKANVQKLMEKSATADTLAKQLADAQTGWAQKEAAWGEERQLLANGLTDPDAGAVARLLYNRIPETSRPKTIGEWLGGLRAEGAAVPPALAPYLKPGAAPAPAPAPAGGAPTPAPAPAPKQPTTTQAPTAGAPVSNEALKNLRERIAKGDPAAKEEYKAIRSGLLSDISQRK